MPTMPKGTLFFDPGSMRHLIARTLSAGLRASYDQLLAQCEAEGREHPMSALSKNLQGLSMRGLIERDGADTWALTQAGLRLWVHEHVQATQAPEPAPTGLQPDVRPDQLTTSRHHWPNTGAETLPMVYRPGALDANALPRVQGNKRIWPCGRTEPI